jgi:hypothetical protein
VGLNHVSNDWRITFISNAARIWSQGLTAGAEETANAIVLILTCAFYEFPVWFIRQLRTKNPRSRKATSFAPMNCLPSA